MKGGADIVLIQEPWVSGNMVRGLRTPGFKLLLSTGNGRHRACILARSNLNIYLLPSFSSEDVVAASLELDNSQYWLASVYMAHDAEAPPGALKTLAKAATEEKKDLIVCSDVNAHHHMWGSTDNNERGESLMEYIISSNLVICNRGYEPTFITRNRQEVLDVTLVTEGISGEISEWKVLDVHSFSDHRYISFCIIGTPQSPVIPRNIRKTDWGRYRDNFNRSIPKRPELKVRTIEDIDTTVERVTSALNCSLNAACPKIRPRGKQRPPWWTPHLIELRKCCRRLFNRAKATRAPQDWDN